MGVVLDPGKSHSEADRAADKPKVGRAIAIFGLACVASVFILGIVASLDAGESGDNWGALAMIAVVLGMVLTYLFVRLATAVEKRAESHFENWLTGSPTPSGPVDTVRTSLQFTPQDGEQPQVKRLGGGGTHIISRRSDSSYVIVVADNGIGVSEGFSSHRDAQHWAENFVVARQDAKALRKEILFTSITEVKMNQWNVTISSVDDVLRLEGWFDPFERSHQTQVHRLIETLGFVEDEKRPGTFLPDPDKQDAVLA